MAGTYKVNGDKLTGLTVYSTLPIGTPLAWLSDALPVGFLKFDGSEYNQSDYPQLWAIVQNIPAFQSETSGKFKIPDLSGRVLQGADSVLGALLEAGLPNIKGGAGVNNDINQPSEHINGPFAYQQGNKGCSDSGTGLVLTFDASRSNPIYSDDCDTVQPPAFTVNWIIKAVDYVSLPQNAIDDTVTTTGNVHSAQKTGQVIDTKINNAKAWKKIFDNPTRQALATITLDEDITGYNEIMLVGTRSNGKVTVSFIYPVEVIQTLTDTDAIGLHGYGDYLYLKYTDAHTLTRTSADNYVMHSVFVR